MKRVWPILFIVLVPCAHALQVIEGQGRAYPIEEVSQKKIIADKLRKEPKKKRKPEELEKIRIVHLTKQPAIARKDRVKQVDISYTLPFDLKDRNGKIIFPKGHKYNPLSQIRMTSLIIIDGENPTHIDWAKKKQAQLKPAKILLYNGSFLRVMRIYNLRVYHLNDQIMDRMQIETVPCTVVQKDQYLEITEYERPCVR
jgi:conjugal transfer pilus assembly protein TraW